MRASKNAQRVSKEKKSVRLLISIRNLIREFNQSERNILCLTEIFIVK